jgi:predicted ATPase
VPVFHAYPARRGGRQPVPQPGSWILRPEQLEDAGFQTTFKLSFLESPGEEVPVGTVKIIRRGQQSGRTPLEPTFENLGPQYASLGAELDYYSVLLDVAGPAAMAVLDGLADIAIDPQRRVTFENEEGFRSSLTRFTPAKVALDEAASLFSVTGPGPAAQFSEEFTFRTSVGGDDFPVTFSFVSNTDLPDRISVIIGPNGSGKTRLLSNLALAAFDTPGEGETVRWGQFDGPVGFSRILAFSYSAFDDFAVPAENRTERETFTKRATRLGYQYFGLRDLRKTAAGDSQSSAPLKTGRQISDDFRLAESAARQYGDGLLTACLETLFEDPSFAAAGYRSPKAGQSSGPQDLKRVFREASTGHKFVLLMTAQLAAHLRPGTLVLVDEPESHLHPPLLATFLTVLRLLLARRDARAIVATHSPFVVQETPARHVRIMTRQVSRTSVDAPAIETFGEDIGTISREVFRLDSRAGAYVDTLRKLAMEYSLDHIESLFENGMSAQGRSFVMAVQARRR